MIGGVEGSWALVVMQLETTKDNKPVIDAGGGGLKVLAVVTNGDESGERVSAMEEALQVMLMRKWE